MDGLAEITDTIGAASMAAKLIARIRLEHSAMEMVLSDVSALWDPNIMDRMESLLKARNYAEITALLRTWREWLASLEMTQLQMRRTMVSIETFVEFYSQEV